MAAICDCHAQKRRTPLSVQAVFAQPAFDVRGDFIAVHFLEHEVAVAGDADLGQIDHGAVAAVGVIMLGEIQRAVAHLFPEAGGGKDQSFSSPERCKPRQ